LVCARGFVCANRGDEPGRCAGIGAVGAGSIIARNAALSILQVGRTSTARAGFACGLFGTTGR
jgi:hypothetical protein